MAGDDAHSGDRFSGAVRPGALSALLLELAAAPASGADAQPRDTGLRAGAVIGRFELVRELGRGGFGVVWEARDRELGRRVAFKVVRAGSRRELREERLLREAEAAARLSHPNIVTLHDVGRSPDGPYLVLELLEGTTLARRLTGGALPVGDAVRIAVEIAKGVAHAHAHGVVHRDLKPENVFLCDDGQVKVLDFGLAHAFGRRRTGGGTPAYMAPEQAEGSPEDERTDVWALGAIVFEMLTGRQAHPDAAHRGSTPSLDVAGMPALGALVARMMAARPRDRPRDAGEVLSVLSAEELTRASPSGPVRTRRSVRRAVALASGAAALVALAVALAARGSKVAGARSDGRLVVAVADVVNETGERDLDVISGLLVTSLEQSRRLAVMTQARVLDLAIRSGRNDAARVDETIGREVGKAQRARALLLPAIRRLASTYSLEMRVIDPVRGEHLFTVSERSTSKEALLDVLDRVSERTRRELGESEVELGASRVHLGEAMTRSLEAYQHYRAGVEAWLRDGQRAVGLREFQAALRLDPGFAPVHSELALLYSWYGRPDLAEPHWRAAAAHGDAMPEKERLVLDMRQAHASPSLERWSRDDALRLADAAVQRFPEDKFVLAWAADAYDAFDVLDRWESALRKALELDPAFFSAASMLSDGLGARVAEALEVSRRAVATRRSAANLALLARALRANGDDAGSAAAARESLSADGGRNSLIAWVACDALHELGDDHTCRPIWDRMASGGGNEHERDFARFRLMVGLAYEGRIRDALALAATAGDPARAAPPAWLASIHQIGRPRLEASRAIEAARRIPHLQVRRNFLSWFGATDEAERISSSLGGRGYEIVEKVNRYYGLVREKKLDEAVDLMRAVRAEIHRRNYSGSLYGAALLEAEALLQAGRTADAVDVWPAQLPCRCTDRMDYAANYPRLALLRARALEQLGRSADAARELDGIVGFWKSADGDLPLLVEAKAMRNRPPATSTRPRAAAAASLHSIAVLPFADLSPGKDQEYLSDGVAEEILNALTHVQGLKVVGRTSSFSFKGKADDLRTIGRRLGVTALLEGSVRRDGDRVRVTTRLVNAADGTRVWSESYERELRGIFALQDEIARAVAARVVPALDARPAAVPTTTPDAYHQVLIGRKLRGRIAADSFDGAARAFERATAVDPSYAPAWAGLADALMGIALLTDAEPEPLLRRALAAADEAIRLSPELAIAHSHRSLIRLSLWDWSGARADAERALSLEPGAGANHARYALVLSEAYGENAAAAEHFRTATELDPLDAGVWFLLGSFWRDQGKLDEAREANRRALELDPGHELAVASMGAVEYLAGQFARAQEWYRRSSRASTRLWGDTIVEHALGAEGHDPERLVALERLDGGRHRVLVAAAHALRGEKDLAFEWLDRAVDRRDLELRWAKRWWGLRPLREDPRWKALLRRMGLPVE